MAYAPQIGNALNSAGLAAANLVPTTQQQLHPSIEDLTRGLGQAGVGLQAILNRLNGPKPTETESGIKSEREPSTLEYLQMAHRQISVIHLQIQQITDSIG